MLQRSQIIGLGRCVATVARLFRLIEIRKTHPGTFEKNGLMDVLIILLANPSVYI